MFILDTDHVTLYQHGNLNVGKRLNLLTSGQLATTIITYAEQISGRLAVVHRAQKSPERIQAYFWLQQTLQFFCRTPILPFNEAAAQEFQRISTLKLRIGTQDLLIAAIVLAHRAVLLTRNRRDFVRVPGLEIEDWTTISE
jgi:tRNA(fMet)-specific endonuclease VapC